MKNLKEYTAAAIKKGDEIVALIAPNIHNGYGDFDYFAIHADLLTCKSMGKKQGTATRLVNGEFSERRIYSQQVGYEVFRSDELADGVAIIRERMKATTIHNARTRGERADEARFDGSRLGTARRLRVIAEGDFWRKAEADKAWEAAKVTVSGGVA